jgi:Tol biopolymer transport system component
MPDLDLDHRLRTLDRLDPPSDLWIDIRVRRPRQSPEPSRRTRAAVIVAGLAMAAIAVLLLVRAFDDARQDRPGPRPGANETPASTNGEIWFRRGGGEGGVWIESIGPDGSNRQVLFRDTYAGGTDNVGEAYDWSPDGSQVAFIDSTRYIGEVPTGSSWDVYTMNADGSGRRQVTDDGAFDAAPSWSPDGTRIVYASDKGDPDRPACEMHVTCNRDIFAMNADGSAPVQLTNEAGADWQPDWGPDGRIVFVSERADAGGDIFVMNADGTDVTRITATPEHEYQPRWSPDGSHIAFVRSDGHAAGLFVMESDRSNEIRVARDLATSFSVEPDILDTFAWSPDGTMLAFAGGAEYSTTLFVVGTDGSNLRALVEEPQYGVGGPAWRPAVSGGDTRTGQAASAVLSPAPRECPVGIGFLRHPRAEPREVPDAMHGHLPSGFPSWFGLQLAYKGDAAGAMWTDGRCRVVTVGFSVGSLTPSSAPSAEHLGRWVVEYDRPDACGNGVMGVGRCTGYLAQASDGVVSVQTIGLSRKEADAVVLSIAL